MLQIKTIPKKISTSYILELLSFTYLYYLTNLARKQLNINTRTLQLSPARNNNNFISAKVSYPEHSLMVVGGFIPRQKCNRCILQP